MEGTSRGECSHLGNATGFFFFFFLNLSKPYSKQDDGVGGGAGKVIPASLLWLTKMANVFKMGTRSQANYNNVCNTFKGKILYSE